MFRIVNSEEGYQLTIDDANDGDRVFEHEGENYLLQAAGVGEGLSNATLDVQESPEGLRPALSEGGASERKPVPSRRHKPAVPKAKQAA